MNEELLDYFDDQERRLGTATRQQIHQQGWWHRTFHCWIVRRQPVPTLLFQERHQKKDTFPGKLDKSAAGHLLAGETPADGLRELEEELGIYPTFHELTFCGKVSVEHDTCSLIDREFCYMYMLASERPITSYEIQQSEVAGLYEVRVEDYKQLVTGQVDSLHVTGADWNERDRRWDPTSRVATIEDFTPQNEAYYTLLFQSITRLLSD